MVGFRAQSEEIFPTISHACSTFPETKNVISSINTMSGTRLCGGIYRMWFLSYFMTTAVWELLCRVVFYERVRSIYYGLTLPPMAYRIRWLLRDIRPPLYKLQFSLKFHFTNPCWDLLTFCVCPLQSFYKKLEHPTWSDLILADFFPIKSLVSK